MYAVSKHESCLGEVGIKSTKNIYKHIRLGNREVQLQ